MPFISAKSIAASPPQGNDQVSSSCPSENDGVDRSRSSSGDTDTDVTATNFGSGLSISGDQQTNDSAQWLRDLCDDPDFSGLGSVAQFCIQADQGGYR